MNDELEWQYAMREAAKSKMPRDIRRLFATIVAFCPVKDKQSEHILLWKLLSAYNEVV